MTLSNVVFPSTIYWNMYIIIAHLSQLLAEDWSKHSESADLFYHRFLPGWFGTLFSPPLPGGVRACHYGLRHFFSTFARLTVEGGGRLKLFGQCPFNRTNTFQKQVSLSDRHWLGLSRIIKRKDRRTMAMEDRRTKGKEDNVREGQMDRRQKDKKPYIQKDYQRWNKKSKKDRNYQNQ